MGYAPPVLLLVIVSALLFLTVWRVHRLLSDRGSHSVVLVVVVTGVAMGVQVTAWVPYARTVAGPGGYAAGAATAFTMATALVGPFLPTAALLMRMLLDAIGSKAGQALYGLDTGRRVGSDFSKARALAGEGDVDGAIAQYWAYFHEYPDAVEPVIEAANMLCDRERHEEAADLLREVLRHVRTNDLLWAQVVFRLAEVLRENLGDPESAHYLYGRIVRRAPRSNWGRLSHARLSQKATPRP